MAVCSGSHQAAHEPHSVLDVFFAKEIVSGAGLTSRTASVARGVGQHHAHVLLQSGTLFQLMQIFKLIEKRILEAILSHGYL